jgi:hypothetical protein
MVLICLENSLVEQRWFDWFYRWHTVIDYSGQGWTFLFCIVYFNPKYF